MSDLRLDIFKLKRTDTVLFLTCVTKEDSRYALADQQGSIMFKGEFTGNHEITIEELPAGFYTLTLLNASAVQHFSVVK